ncbi:uncharacterized protein B0P05DRAFT_118018 [Gilbertella persicaria]|uniref:uncharacterized protein n=1 Tax=Gilbertella persicaria TaxID=101096 RepID=UPI002220E41E|nr:uncharacterized protein B0P05DRAFT_118018 [Gilbertella persicaria]KAI8077935.1 hypothetical protein B0P05DRAFT_118018 [Gilbertella persicaria]
MLRDLEAKIKSVKAFKKESEHFLQEHFDTMESIDIYAHTLPRTVSNPQLKSFIPEAAASSSTDNKYASHRHSMYDESSLFKQQDPFDNKIKDVTFLVKSLGEELSEFKCCLDSTEELVHDVQVDVDDFRNRMETYIKDIPESHYSALKQLEIDIESILSKRAKNPWLDTGYALLSYLLTCKSVYI